ncbi:MAG: LemA family protein [Opitutales bacterium]
MPFSSPASSPFRSSRTAGRITTVGCLLIGGGAVVVLLLLFGLYFLGKYNRVQVLDENVDAAWAQVENVLQRRYDLIPNLVNTVQGFADQELEVLTEVTRLRSQWGEARSTEQKTGIASALEGALGRLMVVVERYPELKSNQNFLALQSQLEGTENRIAVERGRYNEALRTYNSYVRRIPQSLIADPRDEYFAAASGAETAPVVDFGD